MNLLQLQYFKEIAESQNLTESADKLMLSVPSLSLTIKRLETDVGCKLFDRIGKRIQLNENGEILLRYANEILDSAQKARLELGMAQQRTLRLGLSSPIVWSKVINEFLIHCPKASISYDIINSRELRSTSLHSQYDFILAAVSDFTAPDWEYDTLVKQDAPILVVYPGHRFSGRKQIDLLEAKDEMFVALNKDVLSRKFFDDICHAAGFVPNVAISCDYLLRPTLIRSKYGIAITTEWGAMSEVFSELECIPIVSPAFQRSQAIFHYKMNPLAPIANEFRDFVVRYFQ